MSDVYKVDWNRQREETGRLIKKTIAIAQVSQGDYLNNKMAEELQKKEQA